jgi:hypothetical protein
MKWPIWILLLLKTSGFGQSNLENTEFYDGTVFISSELYDWAWTYKFSKEDYKLYLYYHYENPQTYLFEEGKYSNTSREVTLTPTKRLICEIEGIARFDCMTALGPEHGFLVSRDTLSDNEIKEFRFIDRVCFLSKEMNNLTLKDPSIRYKSFKQVIRE